MGNGAYVVSMLNDCASSFLKNVQLDGQRLSCRIGNPTLQIGKLGGCETHRIGKRLPVYEERLCFVTFGQGSRVLRCYFNEVAQHIIVLDLQ